MTPHAAAQQLEWASSQYMLDWLDQMPDVTVAEFGQARAARTPDYPDVDFLNTVHRLLPEDAGDVPRIAEHYAAAGIRPWLELMPAPGFEQLAEALTAAGGRQIGFLAVFERPLPAPPPAALPDGVEVELVTGDGDALEHFARIMPAGHGVPEEALDRAAGRTRRHAAIDRARLYLATVDGVPAAGAVLFIVGGTAYLANAATLEAHRRRGCQTALIARRLADAAQAGCRRACVLTAWDSQSHANVARAGFTAAYTKAVWRLDRPPAG